MKSTSFRLLLYQSINRFALYLLPLFLCLTSLFVTASENPLEPNNLKIGVLANQGVDRAQKRWQPTIDMLTHSIPGYRFELIPLSLQAIDLHVKNASIDFVISNTGNYVKLSHNYGISRIATLVNKQGQHTTTKFGAVIFTKANRDDINSLADISRKNLVAVNRDGFGGFYMAWQEFRNAGITLFSDAQSIQFTGFPQKQVLDAVLNGTSDVGTFRTDALELLVTNGELDLAQIKILNKKQSAQFPFLHSTELYPEWPFSKLKHISRELAHQVSLTLLTIPETSDAAISARSAGWTVPLNYKPAYDLLKSLEVSPFDRQSTPTLSSLIREFAVYICAGLAILFLSSISFFYIYKLNTKLRSSNKQLKSEVRTRIRLSTKLEHIARHDVLTGLFNRRAFTEHLNHQLENASKSHSKFSLLLLDIDKFKSVNDIYGHHFGDLLLKAIALRVSKLLRSNDSFFRIGGDEFAIISTETKSIKDIEILCDRLSSTLETEYSLDGHSINSGMSIGFSIYPEHGNDITKLIKHADANMYSNKSIKTDYQRLISSTEPDIAPSNI